MTMEKFDDFEQDEGNQNFDKLLGEEKELEEEEEGEPQEEEEFENYLSIKKKPDEKLSEKDISNAGDDIEIADEAKVRQQSLVDKDPPEDETNLADSDVEEGVPASLESVIEAVLFASDESLTGSKLAKIAETTQSQVKHCVDTLNDRYKAVGSAFRIEQIAGGYQMLTLPVYQCWLKKLVSVRGDSKLSPAALETLAIISYKQPVIRADIEAIRGVQCGEVIRSLMFKGLVKITGRAEVLGRPMQYGTTKRFLEVFGLNSLKDLPKVEELKKPE